MRDLRSIFILLFLLPAFSLAQTVHIEKEQIVYKGEIEMPGLGSQNVYTHAKSILLNRVNASPDSLKEKKKEKELTTTGAIQLPSPHYIVKNLCYSVKLAPGNEEIEYAIDSVYLIIRERGKKSRIISGSALLKEMDESGKASMEAEKQLNEIDMHIQKLITQMKSG